MYEMYKETSCYYKTYKCTSKCEHVCRINTKGQVNCKPKQKSKKYKIKHWKINANHGQAVQRIKINTKKKSGIKPALMHKTQIEIKKKLKRRKILIQHKSHVTY